MKKIGRPKVDDRAKPVTFTAKESEIEVAIKKAETSGTTLPKVMKKLFQKYISR